MQSDFLTDQKRFERVRTLIKEKQQTIQNNLSVNNLELENFNLLILVYKDSDEFELYAKTNQETIYKKIKSYEICSRSGQLGPKRKQGDYQVPEGFYYIDRFNPTSNFYLSLGINYPNQSDRKKSKFSNLGGDIYIHGSCVTIGCLPMTNDKIKEIYLYAIHAKNNGQSKIPVYIFPFKMTNQNMNRYKSKYKDNKELIDFWTNLKIGYDKFKSENKELKISFAENGDYKY
ncbi:MAG: L,D-transpeptidase family protein [Lentimicrobium sp.]|nr:L,D-transpeptidase family protein [Lentimicrobium sp.]